MTLTAPTFSQIKAQVATIQQKSSRADVIGIQSSGRWSDDTRIQDGDQTYLIYQCDSPLACRIAIREPVEKKTTKVLITGLDENELGDDLRYRLAKHKLFNIDPWQMVCSQFNARNVDTRLTHHPWIAETLLELGSRHGFPPARGGFLDAESAWSFLLEHQIQLRGEAPDLTSLLKWTLDHTATQHFRHSTPEFQEATIKWLSEQAGPVARLILQCVQQEQFQQDPLPIGIAMIVLFHQEAQGKLEKACGKFEGRYFKNHSPEPELMQRWISSAREVVRSLQHAAPKRHRQIVQRSDEILKELSAEKYAYLSHSSLLGFEQRLIRFGETLSDMVSRNSWSEISVLQELSESVRKHDLANQDPRQLERLEMSLRLVRWLREESQSDQKDPQSLGAAARFQLETGGFLDWARLQLRHGDAVEVLSQAYLQLFEKVTQVRERQAQHFSQLLADWTSAGSKGNDVIPVEQILEQIVAPLAAEQPVLLIVIDGMSVAVCRELLSNLTRHEWVALAEPNHRFNRPAMAVIPSVTEFSRTSLLTGKLKQGGQNEEKKGFQNHPQLTGSNKNAQPPLLYHKAGLQGPDQSDLAGDLRKEIASSRSVVGVIVNAVDDNLLKGEQLDTRWSREQIQVLPTLLHEARNASRLVVLVSDHGHVLDCQTQHRPGMDEATGGERWRPAVVAPTEEETLISGSRVLSPGQKLVAPWSERIRYTMKKNGYHGGLSPQEMIVPIVVLSSTDEIPSGWSEQPIDTPAWWDEFLPEIEESKPAAPTKPKRKPVSKTPLLFNDLEDEPETSTPAEAPAVPAWIQSLLESPVFKDQKRLGGRHLPDDATFTRLLHALDRREGTMTLRALTRALEAPPMRMRGILAKTERVLNVDGYDVIRYDETSDTVELQRDLLLKQFGLED
ncbi:BREX-2 system phosphatase PglZ [Gimesia maris]|uniref:BREX-2 system phosphatase PglZ n=1 Tax=Gimesia maris TaxID=122 RepID=UPI0032ECDD56